MDIKWLRNRLFVHLLIGSVFGLVFLIFSGCSQENEGIPIENSPEYAEIRDSVLFQIDRSSYTAIFRKTGEQRQGAADGTHFFQRIGSLEFILSELYAPVPVAVRGHHDSRQHYSIEVKWRDETDFEGIRNDVADALAEEVNYTIRRDTVLESYYQLQVENYNKLIPAEESGDVEQGVEFKSTKDNEKWVLYASIDKLADQLDGIADHRVETSVDDRTSYLFELSLHWGFEDIRDQLETNFGIVLNRMEQPAERIVVTF